jgi:hypothetical protein
MQKMLMCSVLYIQGQPNEVRYGITYPVKSTLRVNNAMATDVQHKPTSTAISPTVLSAFRKAMAEHLNSVRQGIHSQESFLDKAGGIGGVAGLLPGQHMLIGDMRKDLTRIEDQWNVFNDCLDNAGT